VDRQEDTNDESVGVQPTAHPKTSRSDSESHSIAAAAVPGHVLYRAKKPVHIRMYMG